MNIIEHHLGLYRILLEELYEKYREPMQDTQPYSLERYRLIKSFGAHSAALSKRTKRTLLITHLANERDAGTDITPTVALHFANRVIGRGLKRTELNKAFGTPGRTAEHKSTVTQEELAGLEEAVKKELACLVAGMAEIRDELKQENKDAWLPGP